MIRVNGEPRELARRHTVGALLDALGASPTAASPSRSTARSCRAARGTRPRSRDGARVEVVTAVQGG